jgi:hypothetical protein
LAFFNNVILDFRFPQIIYKKLLKHETSLEDLKEIDNELYQNFKYILNSEDPDLKDSLCMPFTVTTEKFGLKEVIPLKVNFFLIF